MPTKMRIAFLPVIGLMLIATLAWTTPAEEPIQLSSQSEATPQLGGIVRIVGYDPMGWDPHKTDAYETHYALSFTHSKLGKFPQGPEHDPGDFAPIGDLAESWELIDDTTLILHLRKGIRWHNKPPVNGRELVAEDVKYTLERIKRVEAPFRLLYDVIDSVEAPDRYTVKVNLSEPSAPILDRLSTHFAVILAKEIEESYGDFTQPETVIGTGPFILKSYRPIFKSVFVRNPDYYRQDLPYVDEIHWLVIPDRLTSLAALRAGIIDISEVPYDDYVKLQRTDPELIFQAYTPIESRFIYMRVDEPPFNDKRVRQAVSMSIDRQGWMDTLWMGTGEIQGAVPAAFTQWFLPLDDLGPNAKYFEYDVSQAKQLLAEAGYPDGFRTYLKNTPDYGTNSLEHSELIRDFLSRVGIDVDANPKVTEHSGFLTSTSTEQFGEMGLGWQFTSTEVDDYVYGMHYTGEARNLSHVDDPVLNEMLIKQRLTFDPKERKKIIDDIQRYLAEQCYYVFPPTPTSIAVWQPWVHNYTPKSDYDLGRQLEEIWIDKS